MIKYYAYVKTIELKSISKAAQALGYSQPGLSHILSAFEKEVGFPLLIKANKTIEPTSNGLKVLEYCHQLIDIEQKLLHEIDIISNKSSGTIRIGTPNSMLVGFVTDLITSFTSKHSNIEIMVQENTLEGTIKSLHDCVIDIAFVTEDSANGYKYFPLFDDEVHIAMHINHPLTSYEKVSFDLIKEYNFIMQIPGWDDIANILLEKLDYKPNIKYYSASDIASLAMVASNLGIYIISNLQETLLPPNVVTRPFEEHLTRNVGICVKNWKTTTSIQKEFISSSQDYIQNIYLQNK